MLRNPAPSRGRLTTIVLAAALLLVALFATSAAASPFAPLNRPGPKLRVAKAKLKASVVCTDDVANATRAPVLLVPATGVNSQQNYSWNYENLFDADGIPYCTSDQPGPRNSNQTDIQVRGQYLTYAIRKVHALAGRKIAVMGHSQGGMAMRWPLRFWPDTRDMVDDVIGMAGTNHGTTGADNCSDGTCSVAGAQQSSKSEFIRALNSRAETFAGISYTEIGTSHDETVTPQPGASYVDGPGDITNVLVQAICPNDTSEHLIVGSSDATAAALALDALNHPGPADPSRISPTVCAEPFMSGVDPVTAPAQIAAALQGIFLDDSAKRVEPPLRCYVFKNGHTCRQQRQASR